MPRTIQLDLLPAGISMSFAVKGQQVQVRAKEFLSSEDGNDFISRLDGVSQCYAQAFGPDGFSPSQVNHLLAIVRKDREAILYCNELNMVAKVRAKKRQVNIGDPVFVNDIADVECLEFQDNNHVPILIPGDCGLTLVLSHGWRKGIYYDYTPLQPNGHVRSDNLPRLFGHFYARLLFQEMFSISEDQWKRLTDWGWFPFIWMSSADRRKLIAWAQQESEPIEVFQEICAHFKDVINDRVEAWNSAPLLDAHIEFVTTAKQSYLNGDYISCIQVLYPRIEGLLRTLHVLEDPTAKPTQASMVGNLVENQYVHSVLLPKRFENYLMEFYFRDFDLQANALPLSRHTVGHGMSLAKDYDLVKASLGFMILDQITYYLSD